jgi:hypothetical protein
MDRTDRRRRDRHSCWCSRTGPGRELQLLTFRLVKACDFLLIEDDTICPQPIGSVTTFPRNPDVGLGGERW